jgi:hypothetical protein
MTEEERQRQIEFILATLAHLTATTSRLAESHAAETSRLAESHAAERERIARDHARLVRLEESFVVLADLASRHEERLDQNDRRAARLEESIAELRRFTEENGGNG